MGNRLPPVAPWNTENPIREEVFGRERFEQHAVSLANAQAGIEFKRQAKTLSARLADNEQRLLEAHLTIARAISAGHSVTPAAEWLVNNSHIIEAQIRAIRKNLPPAFAQHLPSLTESSFAGYPRIFAIAWAYVAHTDSRFDPEMLKVFIAAYQSVTPLTIGELWALPQMIQLVLVENLRRSARRVVSSREQRKAAEALAEAIAGNPLAAADTLRQVSAVDDFGQLRQSFFSELIFRLADVFDGPAAVHDWVKVHLAEFDVSADDLVRREHQTIGSTNNTVRHIIRSLRVMPDTDWSKIFEDISLVDRALARTDTFRMMDFATRNAYRDAIEALARRSPLSEIEIAERAVDQALLAIPASKQADPGYYLVGRGSRKFTKVVRAQYLLRDVPAIIAQKGGLPGYAAAIVLLTAVILAVPLLALVGQGVTGWIVLALGIAGLSPAIDVAVAIVNQAVSHEVKPKIIPGMEFKDGVPAAGRSIVVVPALISSAKDVDELIGRIETHHLATQDANVFYGLVTDWTDANAEHVPKDQQLLDYCRSEIAQLNRKYPVDFAAATSGDGDERFYLFHRARRWNPDEGRWMGWERKRGKLHELNRLLRGVDQTSFIAGETGRVRRPERIKYVITLDSDTRLPRDAAKRLIGKMLHPLNAPVLSTSHQRIVDGYGILQPRVTPSFPADEDASVYQSLFASAGGIDPYAGAVSDVYQDLFGEGSFTGKGIYDLDMFEAVMTGRFPENTVLSHDLLEGLYARAGLATDIEVVEEFPGRYDVARAREHRWARGDWQVLPWILSGRSQISEPGNAPKRETLSALGRWKLIDNLRRSLSGVFAFVSLVLGWSLSLEAAAIWTLFVVSCVVLPSLLPVFVQLANKNPDETARSHFANLGADARLGVYRSAFQLTALADRAYAMSDAIVRTLYRLTVSRKNMLEWTTSAQAQSMSAVTVAGYYGRMIGGIFAAVAAAAFVAAVGGGGSPIAIAFVAVWLAAPLVAHWLSFAPTGAKQKPITATSRKALRLTAWRTWQYFETFVTDGENNLPPDNFQEDPLPVVAHRTSPTNIGLYLLSIVSAQKFGWVSTADAADKLEKTLRTLGHLERYNGHFYNWYNTETLTVLAPRYVSTVDSGNLAGHLLALSSACRTWMDEVNHLNAPRDGIRDCLAAITALNTTEDSEVAFSLRRIEDILDTTEEGAPVKHLTVLDWKHIERIASGLRERFENDSSNPAIATTLAALERMARLHGEQESLNDDKLRALNRRLTAIADTADYLAMTMDFKFLINHDRELLSIGFNADDGVLDESCYDLLASEARLASFIGIAKGDLPARHWFRLGRTLLPVEATTVLSSWSGSMFEYLMPELVTMTPRASLLGMSNLNAVREHMRFGQRSGTPWGVSESAYNVRDLEFTYQYSGFGVPRLGLKRGLDESLVVAPYATGLAAMIEPNAAAENFQALAGLGALGSYGFYEAIDFTPSRVLTPSTHDVVKAYMSHHQGMTIVALANAVFDSAIAKHFHQSAAVQAAELLLQERAPRMVPKFAERATLFKVGSEDDEPNLVATRRITLANAPPSESHIIGNGRMTVVVSPTGSGSTSCDGLAVTRANTDASLDNIGSYVYLRDVNSGDVWSAGYQPVCATPASYEAAFSEDRIQIKRLDGTLESVLDIIVSPEDDATCRRLTITNKGKKKRTIDVTSYEELVLGSADGDAAHPAFSKLFVETAYDAELGAVLAHRRPRGPQDREIWAAAIMTGDVDVAEAEYETDRGRFIGSGRTLASPIAIIGGQQLKNTSGAVLDPILSLRGRINIAPGATVRVCFWTILSTSRDTLAPLVQKYQDKGAFVRAATLAWTVGRVELRHLGINAEEALMFQRLMAAVVTSTRSLRAPERLVQQGAVGLNALWSAGISGDLPIVLVQIDELADIGIVRQCLHAFEYWRRKGLEIDLVVVNDHQASYQQDLQHALDALFHNVTSRHRLGRDNAKGSVFLLRSDLLQPQCLVALQSVARAVFTARRGSLAEQLARLTKKDPAGPPPRRLAPKEIAMGSRVHERLELFNGFGGFQNGGREYAIVLEHGRTTPAPWINVISNPSFGFQVAADGAGFTWSVNSRERQLTPWGNDPVINRPGEVFYVRDEETGELWCPTASPIRDHAAPYIIAHGQGYTRFEHTSRGIELVLEQFVAPGDPVKISRLVLRNVSGKPRSLSVTSYIEWVLGTTRRQSPTSTTTDYDAARKTIFGRNPFHAFFPERVAFATLLRDISAWTADRADFLGQSGRLDNPSALAEGRAMHGLCGTGFDPCAVLKTNIHIPASGEVEITALLGDADSRAHAHALIAKFAAIDASSVLTDVISGWDAVINPIQISTPDRALDLLVNRWLPYQSLSSRLWARAGLYQAGGAYGFRDQLQDVMSFAATRPEIARAHILTAASRQFEEGDVQHWWLHPSGHGIRTKIADSCLWLPFVTAHYVKTSGDVAVLHESVPFIDGPKLKVHEHESYFLPQVSGKSASLYEHCARALDRSLHSGAKGLSLFGSGDWNDGMNRVGIGGTGESVWLSWFVIKCLNDFIGFAEQQNDGGRVAAWRAHRDALTDALDVNAWDGGWYRRGYFDDGTPLGSASSTECRIDSIAQSWSVISKAGDPVRARTAMSAVEAQLIDADAKLALLFTPPFDKSAVDPGYIKGYPAGIRENGGQYTHAAAWSAIAFAELGDGDAAGRLLTLINPITIAGNEAQSRHYRLEPYVIAADVYSTGANKGRGGWSWYTGSAGWYYRAVVEHLLGIRKLGDTLLIAPVIPSTWPGFEVSYLIAGVTYRIVVNNPDGVSRGIGAALVNGRAAMTDADGGVTVPLTRTEGTVNIVVTMGIERATVAAQ